MTIPTSSEYPTALDTDTNLYVVHDALRMTLAEDYNPGDTSVTVDGDSLVMANFPPSGLITLTEQVSDIDLRAISFFYASKSDTQFLGIEILPGFADVVKSKDITHVTLNVIADHHNNLKNALIAIEIFLGIKGTVDRTPFGPTITGRMAFLKKLVFTPKAWFSANKRVGLIPLTVQFTNQSFRLGTGTVYFTWDFGDASCSIISYSPVISVTSMAPIDKTYPCAGKFSVKLTVENEFGTDIVEFSDLINARIEAPNEADIILTPRAGQLSTNGNDPPLFDRLATHPAGPWTIPPTIRSCVNTFVDMEVPTGEDPIVPGRTYAGELLNHPGGSPIDPILTYTWSLGDDLTHRNSNVARASYSIGGVYDLKLRVDTTFGDYRITTYENVIDIIERRNLWLFNITSGLAKANEFGMVSETFKVATKTQTVARDDSFLTGTGEETRAKAEFKRNVGFTPITTVSSGENGDALIVWASGGPLPSGQSVNSILYNGFSDVYATTGITINRPWNWIFLSSGSKGYFLFGPDPLFIPNMNLSNQQKTTLTYAPFTVNNTNMASGNYKSGAGELQEHITDGYSGGEPNTGRFAVYRTAWKDQTGYILRNDGVGAFFRLKSFYKTEGTLANPFVNITKLPDIVGSTKLEGQLVGMDNGIFFFNNTGIVAAYNEITGAWETGSTTTAFYSVQDSTASDFDNPANTLLAASDGDRQAYLSFDYSSNAFIKFNGIDLTFSNLGTRPSGEQWVMNVY